MRANASRKWVSFILEWDYNPVLSSATMNWTMRRRFSPAFWLGLTAVAAARLLTLPQSLWEWDEILFVRGVQEFDPLHHQPHPPGYPLLIGLGKLLNAVVHDPFASLVALSVISSLIGYAALVWAFRRIAGPEDPAAAERVAVGGAVLFHLCPPMLVYGPLALSDSPALMFLSLALAAAAAIVTGPVQGRGAWTAAAFGAFAAAAIGCRPQLALSVLPMMAVVLVLGAGGQEGRWRIGWRRAGIALASFTLVCLLWFVPLVAAVGGLEGFLGMTGKQAQLFATYDAKVPRAQLDPAFIVFRFIAHPWGQRWTSLPVLALAGVGFLALARRRPWRQHWRPAAPLFVLSGVELALCLLAMSPADGVRYALPSLLGVAFLAALGCQALARMVRLPAAALVPVALLAAGFVTYTAPFLRARTTTLSPPAQAAEWARRSLPADSVLLIEKELAAHGTHLMHSFRRTTAQKALDRFARSSQTPLYLVGDGASGWPGARTFEWPASDAYGKLTRNLYRVVSISPIPPERRYRAVRGVHAFEPSLRDPRWRWLEPDAAIRLFPVRARAVSLKLGLPAHAPIGGVRVRLSAPGTEAVLEIPRGEERTAVLPLPGEPVFEIGLRSDRSFIPARNGGSADHRHVAVQLLSVELVSR